MEYDLIIIGAGPAGLTAAIYAKRALIKVLLLEKELPGGKLNKTAEVDNYPGFSKIGGVELAEKMIQHARNYEIDWENNQEVIKLVKTENENFEIKTIDRIYLSKSVIIASGTTENKLGIIGEKEFTNYGVSYCAICDGFLFKNKVVAVVGGGYSACEAALYLSNIASKVYLIHRRQELRVEKEIEKQVTINPKIELILNTVVEEIKGETKEGKKNIKSLTIFNLIKKEQETLNISALFPCVGLIPLTNFTHSLICNKQGYIEVDDNYATKITGLFAAGDIVKPFRIKQIATAIADGAVAAQNALQYLEKRKSIK